MKIKFKNEIIKVKNQVFFLESDHEFETDWNDYNIRVWLNEIRQRHYETAYNCVVTNSKGIHIFDEIIENGNLKMAVQKCFDYIAIED